MKRKYMDTEIEEYEIKVVIKNKDNWKAPIDQIIYMAILLNI